MTARRSFSTLCSMAGLFALSAAPSLARDNHTGQGSAITPQFSVQRDTLVPDGDAVLLACVTNANRHSGREVERSDAFTFEFGGGTLGACTWAGLVDFGGETLSGGSFACEVDERDLTLRWDGPTVEWPFGVAVCAKVRFRAPSGPFVVATSYEVGNEGAFAPPQPSTLMIGVDGDLGVEGPVGPQGPPGESAVGQVALAQSTEYVFATQGEPAVAIPGLEIDVVVEAGSRLAIDVDSSTRMGETLCWSPGTSSFFTVPGALILELDGARVASRQYSTPNFVYMPPDSPGQAISWLTDALPPGSHRVRVLLEADAGIYGHLGKTPCIGGPTGSSREARLRVIELKQ